MLHSHFSLSAMLERCGVKILENLGTQRYGLANHLYWLTKGLPGGHIKLAEFFSQETKASYANDLINLKMCDTLWLVAQKES